MTNQIDYSTAKGKERCTMHDEIRGPERRVTFSLCLNFDTIVPDNLNRYDREQFNKTEPLTSLDSVAQLASAMATFSLCSNDTCSRGSRSVWL